MTSERSETVSLWSIWKAHRDALPLFGEVCRMAREGRIPGAVPVEIGTPVVMADRVPEALGAMKKRGDLDV